MILMLDSQEGESLVITLDNLDAYFENQGNHKFFMEGRVEPIMVFVENKDLSKKIKDEVLNQFKKKMIYDEMKELINKKKEQNK